MSGAADLWGRRPVLVASTYRTPDDPATAATLSATFGTATSFDTVIATVVDAARDQLKGTAR
jgi:CRISPR system Cascade subunit CasC